MSFKETMIQQAEAAINSKRERKAQLEDELSTIDTEMEEARAILQLLRTGKVSTNGKRRLNSHGDYMAAIDSFEDTFTKNDVAELMGLTTEAAGQKLRAMNEIEVVQERSPGIPTAIYRKKL